VPTTEPGRRRKALLVIHGIGDQPPLRTLGAFVQGLMWAAGRPGPGAARPGVAFAELGGRPRPLVRAPAGTLCDGAEVDVLEYHWAEHAVGRMSALATFAWLLEVTAAGLDFRRQLPFLLASLGPRRAGPLVLRQLLLVTGLAGLAAGLLVALLLVVARAREALAALRLALERLPDLPAAPEAVGLALLACLLAALAVLGRDLLLAWLEARAVARRHPAGAAPGTDPAERGAWHGLHATPAARWAGPGALALGVALLAALGLAHLLRGVLAAYAAALRPLLAEPGVTVGLAALLLAAAARRLLLSHVADIALYVTSDRLSSRARTRRAILDEGEALLRGLLAAGYDEVYLAGHSLGSVVALDLLDRLARRAPGVATPDLARVRGLLTFGSPLDKVAFFFRQRPGEGEAVRAQLLTALHGVRRRPDERDHGPYALAPVAPPFAGLDWLQVHAPGDLLSDRLLHYRVDRRVTLPRYEPFTAHVAYWRDERFFAAALGWLRGEGAVAAARAGAADRCYAGGHERARHASPGRG